MPRDRSSDKGGKGDSHVQDRYTDSKPGGGRGTLDPETGIIHMTNWGPSGHASWDEHPDGKVSGAHETDRATGDKSDVPTDNRGQEK